MLHFLSILEKENNMCGFFIHFSEKVIDNDKFNQSLNLILARGPDSTKIWKSKDSKKIVGFNRLSIIDPSSESDQPMIDDQNKYLIVFNGEIYNYKKLKDELISEKINFKTKSDTEVILKGFIHWGEDKLYNKLRGMFSVVIFNLENNDLVFFRDRVGMKPLYYFNDDDDLLISSEIKPIINQLDLKKKFSFRKNCSNFFTGIIDKGSSENHTLFNEIYSSRPGEIIKKKDKLSFNRIVSLEKIVSEKKYLKNKKDSFSNQCLRLKKLLYESVEEHLVTDSGIGIMFSGGLDSALISKIASDVSKKKLTLFKNGNDLEDKSDNQISKNFAKELGFDLVITNTNEKDMLVGLPKMLFSMESINQLASIPLGECCNTAKKYGFKSLLTGDGADELFMGYNKHVNYYFTEKYNSSKFLRKFNNFLRIFFPYQDLEKQNIDYLLPNNLNSILSNIIDVTLYSSDRLNQWNEIKKVYNFEKKNFIKNTNSLLLDELKYRFERFLLRSDRYGMANSVELRMPYLDNRILDFSLNVPCNNKFGFDLNFKDKYAFSGKKHLKKIASIINLDSIFIKKKKIGTFIPVRDSFRKLIFNFNFDNYSEYFKSNNIKKYLTNNFNYLPYTIPYNTLCTEILLRLFRNKETVSGIQEEIKLILDQR